MNKNKRIGAGLAAVAAGAALALAAPAGAAGHQPPPPHGHVMLLGVDEAELTYRHCVDLAGGRAVPNQAHHANLHTGRAGLAVARAGHAVIPTVGILPPELRDQGILPENCADVDAWLEGLRSAQ